MCNEIFLYLNIFNYLIFWAYNFQTINTTKILKLVLRQNIRLCCFHIFKTSIPASLILQRYLEIPFKIIIVFLNVRFCMEFTNKRQIFIYWTKGQLSWFNTALFTVIEIHIWMSRNLLLCNKMWKNPWI